MITRKSQMSCMWNDFNHNAFLKHRKVSDLALLHCTGIYPTENEDQQLQFMRRMMERYPHLAIGYSGHEAPDNFSVAPAAVAMGAQIMEQHVGLPTENIKLNAYSMNPEQTARWVEVIMLPVKYHNWQFN